LPENPARTKAFAAWLSKRPVTDTGSLYRFSGDKWEVEL
jgi:hypothetical protein